LKGGIIYGKSQGQEKSSSEEKSSREKEKEITLGICFSDS
jgi:hypothetical protein